MQRGGSCLLAVGEQRQRFPVRLDANFCHENKYEKFTVLAQLIYFPTQVTVTNLRQCLPEIAVRCRSQANVRHGDTNQPLSTFWLLTKRKEPLHVLEGQTRLLQLGQQPQLRRLRSSVKQSGDTQRR